MEGLYEEKKRNRKTVTSKLGSVESQLEAVQRKKIRLEAIRKLGHDEEQGEKIVDQSTLSRTPPVPNISVPKVITKTPPATSNSDDCSTMNPFHSFPSNTIEKNKSQSDGS